MIINQKVNRESPTPVYYQVFLVLKELIDSNEFKEGDLLPSERYLCETLNVSRITIRKALDKLEDSGYIKKEHGKNSQVLKRFNPLVWTDMKDFARDMLKKGKPLTSIILAHGYVEPTEKVKRILNLRDDEKVYLLKRIRLAGDVRISLSISYLVDSSMNVFNSVELDENISIKKVWSENGVVLNCCDETLQAKIPSKEMVELLDLEEDTAIFQRERITFNDKQEPIEYVIQYLNADYSKYYIEKGEVT